MGQKEKNSPIHTLIVGTVENEQGGKDTIELRFKPKFNLQSSKAFASRQVEDATPKRITLYGKDKKRSQITAYDLRKARLSPYHEQKEFIDRFGYAVYTADRVVIQKVPRVISNRRRKS